VERLAPLPVKPRSVIIERWLPYPQVKRRVILNHVNQNGTGLKVKPPKNVIIQWEPPEVKVTTKYTYLGVIKADPRKYQEMYGPSLVQAKEMPDFVKKIPAPEGVRLAADCVGPSTSADHHQLEGDLHSLKYVDLEAEGLAQYRPYLQRVGVIGSTNNQQQHEQFKPINTAEKAASHLSSKYSDMIQDIFNSIDVHKTGRLGVIEIEQAFQNLNYRLGRNYGRDELRTFFGSLDLNKDRTIDFQEFRQAFLHYL
jgi:hypothetical protein